MNDFNITSKDLNLLVVFDALYRFGNVSKAANALSLSQSAVSHALSRLRDMFLDPLFTRTPRGVAPTPRAAALAPRISELIIQFNALFNVEQFSPQKAQGKISIASSEFMELTVLEKALREIREQAPGVIFQMRNVHGKLPKEAIERGEVDIAIAGYFGNLPEGFYQQKLFESDFVTVVKKGHSKVKTKLTLETYLELEHYLISPQGDLWGIIDERLLGMKKHRKVVAGFENYLTPGWVVAHSEGVATVPRALGEFYKKNWGVELYDVPLTSPKITIVQAWHERTHTNPLHKWLRVKIQESAKHLQMRK